MVMATGLEQFVQRLVQSGLMTAAEVEEFRSALPLSKRDPTGEDFARELVHARRLTKFQATAVFQGRTQGLIFGDYRVLDKIGAGGMGMVFKAQHRQTGRVVALKVLSTQATKSSHAVKRFQQEARTAGKLQHPNIAATYETGEVSGTHYLVMQFVSGPDLRTLVKNHHPLPVSDVVNCTLHVARGLQYAHQIGIIHRDIKPANLLLDSNASVLILDMGLARIQNLEDEDEGARLTMAGQMLGTPEYMAPEQVDDPRSVSAAADVYSLGCTLFCLAGGEPPFRGRSLADTLTQQVLAPIPSLKAKRPDVPDELDALCRRMLAKKPAERPPMSEVLAVLEKLQKGGPMEVDRNLLLDQPSTAGRSTESFSLGGGVSNDRATADRQKTASRSVPPVPNTQVSTGTKPTPAAETSKAAAVPPKPPVPQPPQPPQPPAPPRPVAPPTPAASLDRTIQLGDMSIDGAQTVIPAGADYLRLWPSSTSKKVEKPGFLAGLLAIFGIGAKPKKAASNRGANAVDCTAFVPLEAPAGKSCMIQVALHRPDERDFVQMVTHAQIDADPGEVRCLELVLPEGARVDVQVCLPDLPMQPLKTLIWDGSANIAAFTFDLPLRLPPGFRLGTVIVSREGVPCGHIRFRMQVTPSTGPGAANPRTAKQLVAVGSAARRYRQAFVISAPADRANVLKHVQKLDEFQIETEKKLLEVAPEERWTQKFYTRMDDADVVLLYWSRAASDSMWLLREARYAVALKRSNELHAPEIVPIPVEDPLKAPPPADMAHLPFQAVRM